MDYSRSFPIVDGLTPTEGHARYCRENGHATHTVDGVSTGICPRCGAVRDTMDDVDDQNRGLIVEGTDGSRYYRHFHPSMQDECIAETLEFAGDGSRVIEIRECTRREHVGGVSNCTYGRPRHRS